jgi:hypothetical protein
MVERGELDLAAMVIDPDARLLVDALREHNLQIVDLASTEALAHRLPSARAGVIRTGYYDPVRPLPPADKHVLQVDTLVIANGCARQSVTQGVISALARVYPEFVRINREQPNLSGLQYASAAQSYFDQQGPDPVGQYFPWLIDIMPTARWLQLVFAFSMLFGGQAMLHRFRLWRLDADRVAIESELARVFAPGISVQELEKMVPEGSHRTAEVREDVDVLIAKLEALSRRCRRQSLSMLVPMGQEMSYRYQEGLVAEWLNALRSFRATLHAADRAGLAEARRVGSAAS